MLEDDALIGLLMGATLKARGERICGPHTSVEAAMAALDATMPDAALLDVSLGAGATSLPVADALAERGVPFAFITGYGPETAAVVAAHPSRLVIPKPVDAETVGLLLDELMPQDAGEAPGRASRTA